MATIFRDLLAADALAQKAGCGLKPELRAAMEASLRFPAVAASPMQAGPIAPSDLPDNVVPITEVPGHERKRA